jgi:hypothetical protein
VAYRLRIATLADGEIIRELISRSIRVLGAGDYTSAQIEAALLGAFGLDTQLISDGTYFVALTEAQELVACGGWSRRKTLFGNDARAERDNAWLDPADRCRQDSRFFC